MRTIFVLSYMAFASISPTQSTPEVITRLDGCIQRRFGDTRAFGMRRILPNEYHGVRLFQPENAAEREVVDELRRQNYDVAFFLAGRGILAGGDARRSRVQGPAFVTPSQSDEFPQPGDLLAESRSALLGFEAGGGYDVRKSGWTIALRPLRAASEICVQCHKANANLKIGDPLGVAIYAYRSH